jgi:DNA adenine methylase
MIEPFLKWAGGKRWLISKYYHIFPETYKRYIEPFLGSGAVFFHVNPKQSILSDINSALIDTFRAIKLDWTSVHLLLQKHHANHTRDYYYKIRATNPTTLSSKAARFIYLNRTCWNGLYRVNFNGKFNVPIGTKNKVITENDRFDEIAKRLQNTVLHESDFEPIINKACCGDFLFVDPPYTVNHSDNGFIKYNEQLFQWEDQVRLSKCLIKAKKRGAKIILTNAYHESIYNLYSKSFKCVKVGRSSVIAADSLKRRRCDEFIITNI